MVHGMAYISTGISTQNKFQGFLEYDMLRGKKLRITQCVEKNNFIKISIDWIIVYKNIHISMLLDH